MDIDHKSRERVFHYLVEDHASRMPDKICLVMDDRSMTYGELDREVNRWARGLAAHGVAKGDRVLVMITSGIEHIVIWQAISQIGRPDSAGERGL